MTKKILDDVMKEHQLDAICGLTMDQFAASATHLAIASFTSTFPAERFMICQLFFPF
jgi:hypothetical protein